MSKKTTLSTIIMALIAIGCSTVSSNAGPTFGATLAQAVAPNSTASSKQMTPANEVTELEVIEQNAPSAVPQETVPAGAEPTYKLNQNKPDIGSPEYADEYDDLDEYVDGQEVVGC